MACAADGFAGAPGRELDRRGRLLGCGRGCGCGCGIGGGLRGSSGGGGLLGGDTVRLGDGAAHALGVHQRRVDEGEDALGREQLVVVEGGDGGRERGGIGLALRGGDRVAGDGEGVLGLLHGARLEDAAVGVELLHVDVRGIRERPGLGDAVVLRGDGALDHEARADHGADGRDGACGDEGSASPALGAAPRPAGDRLASDRFDGVLRSGGRLVLHDFHGGGPRGTRPLDPCSTFLGRGGARAKWPV